MSTLSSCYRSFTSSLLLTLFCNYLASIFYCICYCILFYYTIFYCILFYCILYSIFYSIVYFKYVCLGLASTPDTSCPASATILSRSPLYISIDVTSSPLCISLILPIFSPPSFFL